MRSRGESIPGAAFDRAYLAADRAEDGLPDLVGAGGRQLDDEGAAGRAGRLDRQPGLARSARAQDRDQARHGELPADAGQLLLASDQGREGGGMRGSASASVSLVERAAPPSRIAVARSSPRARSNQS